MIDFRGQLIKLLFVSLIFALVLQLVPAPSHAEEINLGGWLIPDLKGLVPYSILIQNVDGVEKIVERFYTSDGGHIARISGNGKVFAYVVDRDREPPIDYLLLDTEGFGKFTKKLRPDETYSIPEWVYR